MAFLDLGRDVHLLMQARFGLVDAQARYFLQFFPFLPVDRKRLRRLVPVRQFPLKLDQARLELVARLAAVAYFRLEARHLGIGRVHVALCLMQCIAGRKVRLPGLLGTRLGLA